MREMSVKNLDVIKQLNGGGIEDGSEELIGAKAVGLTTVMMTDIIRIFWPERIPPRRSAADFGIEQLAGLC